MIALLQHESPRSLQGHFCIPLPCQRVQYLLVLSAGSGDTDDARSSGYDDVEVVDVNSYREAPSIGCATKADVLTQSQTLIAVLETAMWSLKEVGAQGSVAHISNEIRKEKRRARASSSEDQEALNALARQRDAEMALERTRRLMLQEGNNRAQTAAKLNE